MIKYTSLTLSMSVDTRHIYRCVSFMIIPVGHVDEMRILLLYAVKRIESADSFHDRRDLEKTTNLVMLCVDRKPLT